MIKQEINEIKRLYTPATVPSHAFAAAMWMGKRIRKPPLKKRFSLFPKRKYLNILNCFEKPFPAP